MVKLNHFWTLTPIDHQIALLMTKFWFFYNYCQFLFITKRTTFVLGSWRNSLPWTQSRWSWRNRFCLSLDRHGQVSLPWTKITRLRHRCCHHQVSPKEIQISRPNKFRIPKIQITQPSHHCISVRIKAESVVFRPILTILRFLRHFCSFLGQFVTSFWSFFGNFRPIF